MSAAQGLIAAMITPALLILGSASLIATVLVRLGRAVDRTRVLIGGVDAARAAGAASALDERLRAYARRACYAERALSAFFAAVVVFVAACLFIGVDRASGERLGWLPIGTTITGMMLLLAGAGWMLAECRIAMVQISDEIQTSRSRLRTPERVLGRDDAA